MQLELLTGEELDEAVAGLAFLRALPEVDPDRIAVTGHSFGGSLTLLLAARVATLRAAVVFAGAAYSWDLSPGLRARLLAAVRHTAAEMQRLGRPHRLKVYPAAGRSAREGHNLVFRNVATWEPDVFAFLDSRLRH